MDENEKDQSFKSLKKRILNQGGSHDSNFDKLRALNPHIFLKVEKEEEQTATLVEAMDDKTHH